MKNDNNKTTKKETTDEQKKKNNLFIIFLILIILLLVLLSRCECQNKKNKQTGPANQNVQANQNTNVSTNTNSNVNTNTNNNSNTNSGNNNGNSDDQFPDLSGCVVGMIVDYHSEKPVSNATEAGEVFKEYILWAKENNKPIFDTHSDNWQFQSASPHGIYQGIKYWRITALRFSEEKQEWVPQTIFDVNEQGQVVRLLGCI